MPVTKKATRGFNPDTGRFYHSNATTVSTSSEVSDFSESASEWTRSQPNSQASLVSGASEEADAGAGGGVAGKLRRRNSAGKKVKPSKMRKRSSGSRVSSSATEIGNIDEEETSMV